MVLQGTVRGDVDRHVPHVWRTSRQRWSNYGGRRLRASCNQRRPHCHWATRRHPRMFYHLTQSTWRHIQEMRLVPLYNKNKNVKQFWRMSDALAFLHVVAVPDCVAYLRGNILECEGKEKFEQLLNYLDRTRLEVFALCNVQTPADSCLLFISVVFHPSIHLTCGMFTTLQFSVQHVRTILAKSGTNRLDS